MILLNNVNAPVNSDEFLSKGGKAVIIIRGDDFTNVTVDIEIASSNDDSNRWAVMNNGSFIEASTVTLDYLPVGVRLRASATGVSANQNIFVEILQ